MEDNPGLFLDPFGSPNPKKPVSPGDELLELIWQNGTVVKQTQGSRKPQTDPEHRPESGSGPANLEDYPSWFQYPFEDTLEKDIYQEYFSEITNFSTSIGANSDVENVGPTNFTNFPHFSRSIGKSKEIQHKAHCELGESSKLGSSACASDQEQATVEHVSLWFTEETETTRFSSERMPTSTEMTATSSSGASGGNFGKFGDLNAKDKKPKGKVKEGEGSDSHSEDAEDNEALNRGKSVNKRTSKRRSRAAEVHNLSERDAEDNEALNRGKSVNKRTSKRRSRAAEVHNLSERRRRDRINEKMRSLQELIPHCNKSDKASILDEAIEYLKSLQMQVQMMWMGSGMPPMMYPGVNPLMGCMGPVNPANMPQMQGLVQMPRVPFINPTLATLNPMSSHLPQFAVPALNPTSSFRPQIQTSHIAPQRGQQAAQVANSNVSGSHIAQSIQASGPSCSIILPGSAEFSTDTEKK